MVLTDEQESDKYIAATMEVADSAQENLYYSNLTNTRVDLPAGYPTDTTTNPNNKVARLNGGSGGPKIGPGITLKVMAGDQFSIRVSSWYRLNGATPNAPGNPLNDLLAGLISGIGNLPGGGHPSTSMLQANSTPLSSNITEFLSDTGLSINSSKPHAFVNWILFDNQFNYVAESSGFDQVGSDTILKKHVLMNLPVTKSGYLYIYLSNETPNIDVFFDNLQVTHTRGAMLEEDHYYPFGLTMAGISDKALKGQYAENKYRYNKGSELQNKEFSDGSGLEMYDTHFRQLDPQLGRWWQIDPKCDNAINPFAEENDNIQDEAEVGGLESISPYTSMGNDPIKHNDPKGDIPGGGCCELTVDAWQQTQQIAQTMDPEIGRPVTEVLGTIVTVGVFIYEVGTYKPVPLPAPAYPGAIDRPATKPLILTLPPDTKKPVVVKTEGKTFNGKQDTHSDTKKEAFNKAKDQNGIPRSAQPDRTIKVDEVSKGKPTGKKLREYQYTNSNGKKVSIRKDNKTTYPEGGQGGQGDHYNAGQTGGKLKQHHTYGEQ